MLGKKTSAIIFLVVATITVAKSSQYRDHSDCYSSDPNPYLKFATKTAYDFVYERPRHGDRNDEIPDCEPVQVWLLSRHGTRYPSRGDLRHLHHLVELRNEVIRNHEERKNGRLCYSDLDNLKTWSFNLTMGEASLLSKQGWTDMYFMAKRLRTKYPSLFNQGYSPNLYIFRHTDSERTTQSAQAFAQGLFGPDPGIWIPHPLPNDTVIKPYENCTSWQMGVKENPTNQRQAELFKLGPEMSNTVHNVSQRLGFLYDLSLDTILSLYDMCRYDKAWNLVERSPWCAAFNREELMVLEYLEDLEAFYDAGYGNELNTRIGCTTVKDMIEKFDQLEDENLQRGYQPMGVFYFTHSKMISMTIARLGILNQGIKLRHDNFYEQRKRQWKTSDITPFAGNLAAVFFKCTSGDYNRIMFFLNEKRVDYDGCDVGLCSWKYIRTKFFDLPLECNLDWCSSGSHFLPIPIVLVANWFLNTFLC